MATFSNEVQTEIADFRGGLPAHMPDYAVALYARLSDVSGDKDDALLHPSGGRIRTTVLLVNPSPQSEHVSVLCLADAKQVACSPDSRTWQMTIGPAKTVSFPVDIAVSTGTRLDFPILVAGDDRRPEEGSHLLTTYIERRPATPAGQPPPNDATPLGGCDIATIVDHMDPKPTFKPPGHRSAAEQLFLTIEPCRPPIVAEALLIGDSQEVVRLPSPWNTPLRLDQPGTALALPTNTKFRELQPVVLLHDGGRASAWISHSVVLE